MTEPNKNSADEDLAEDLALLNMKLTIGSNPHAPINANMAISNLATYMPRTPRLIYYQQPLKNFEGLYKEYVLSPWAGEFSPLMYYVPRAVRKGKWEKDAKMFRFINRFGTLLSIHEGVKDLNPESSCSEDLESKISYNHHNDREAVLTLLPPFVKLVPIIDYKELKEQRALNGLSGLDYESRDTEKRVFLARLTRCMTKYSLHGQIREDAYYKRVYDILECLKLPNELGNVKEMVKLMVGMYAAALHHIAQREDLPIDFKPYPD